MASRFSLEDLQRLVALAASAAGGRTLEERILETLHGVRSLVPYVSGDIFVLEPARQTGQALYVEGIEKRDLDDYIAYYRHHDPMGKFILGAMNQVKTLSDAASPREVARTEYSDLLARCRVMVIAGWSQPIGDGKVVAVAVQRQQGMPDFTDRERTALGLVFPLLAEGIKEQLAPPRGLALLSPAERAVVELLLRGLADRTIAARLGVGYATVRTHIQHAFAKLRVSNRTELVHAIVSERPTSLVLP